jgi:hypothetical protein
VIADVAISSDLGAGKDVGERPDTRTGSHVLTLAQSG